MAKKKSKARAEPQKKRSAAFLCNMQNYEILCGSGYTRLSENPEIMAAVNKIADLISNMTIQLFENTEKGDIRVKNELSRKIDINPNRYMTRKTFIAAIVRILLLEGRGNAVLLPVTKNGLLEDLVIMPPEQVSFLQNGYGYKVLINGTEYDPDEIVHIPINPDPAYPWKGTGYQTTLRDIAKTLKQAMKTKDGFMESKWNPSVIVKVDALTEEFSSKSGRKQLLKDYIETSEAGEPWMIPAEQFEIEQIRPLSLTDIALPDSVKLDKKTAAAILDVPCFIVGEGEYNAEEWNNFINTRIRGICAAIEQALTKQLLLSPDWYFKFSVRSVYSYDIEKLSKVGDDNYTRGIVTGNEVRDWLGMPPKEGLDELIILENYIPQGMIGDQKKLKEGGE
ncbi:phage portal protein [Clostridium sp. AF15-17LB]|nr:phage portal protein [Clostridium sp. AF15-17LB]